MVNRLQLSSRRTVKTARSEPPGPLPVSGPPPVTFPSATAPATTATAATTTVSGPRAPLPGPGPRPVPAGEGKKGKADIRTKTRNRRPATSAFEHRATSGRRQSRKKTLPRGEGRSCVLCLASRTPRSREARCPPGWLLGGGQGPPPPTPLFATPGQTHRRLLSLVGVTGGKREPSRVKTPSTQEERLRAPSHIGRSAAGQLPDLNSRTGRTSVLRPAGGPQGQGREPARPHRTRCPCPLPRLAPCLSQRAHTTFFKERVFTFRTCTAV